MNDNQYRAALIRLKAATGMRRGEIAGLQWEDIELDGDPPQVTVPRSIPDLRGNGGVQIGVNTGRLGRSA